MRCEEAEEARLARASGPIDEAALAAHLAGCARCRAFAAEIDEVERRLSDALRTIAADGVVGARGRAPPRSRTRLRLLAAAAALLVASGIAWLLLTPRGPLPRAEITLSARGRARVEERSPVRALRLEAGALHCKVEKGSGPFEVRTALGTVAVIGTEFTVALSDGAPTSDGGNPVKINRKLMAGGGAAIAVGVVAGIVTFRTPAGDARELRAGEVAFADALGKIEVEELAKLREKAAAAERIPELEKELEKMHILLEVTRIQLHEAEAKAARGGTPGKHEAGTSEPAPAASQADAAQSEQDRKVEAIIKKIDWAGAAKSLVALTKAQRRGQQPSTEAYGELSKLNTGIMELSKELGLDNAFGAWRDPRVQDAFAPVWYSALGANLDPDQASALGDELRRERAAGDGAGGEGFVEKTRARVEAQIQTEEALTRLLRPEQIAGYLETVGDDPFFGQQMQQKQFAATGAEAIADRVAAAWADTFQLGDAAREAARAVAGRYVAAALDVPRPDPALAPPARRVAALRRAEKLLDLQKQAEDELAREPALAPDERARVEEGEGYILDVELAPATNR